MASGMATQRVLVIASNLPSPQTLCLRCSCPFNIAAPSSICTKKERREAIYFLFEDGMVKLSENVPRMHTQYGDSCFYDWIEGFKQGRTFLCDCEKSDNPLTSTTEGSHR
ncbi:hypothetical protein TNCV_4420661 [Trichonephila clavipes]|nr:hypothetical protein TNCV_4420661 [Trichonephila clavipes]